MLPSPSALFSSSIFFKPSFYYISSYKRLLNSFEMEMESIILPAELVRQSGMVEETDWALPQSQALLVSCVTFNRDVGSLGPTFLLYKWFWCPRHRVVWGYKQGPAELFCEGCTVLAVTTQAASRRSYHPLDKRREVKVDEREHFLCDFFKVVTWSGEKKSPRGSRGGSQLIRPVFIHQRDTGGRKGRAGRTQRFVPSLPAVMGWTVSPQKMLKS